MSCDQATKLTEPCHETQIRGQQIIDNIIETIIDKPIENISPTDLIASDIKTSIFQSLKNDLLKKDPSSLGLIPEAFGHQVPSLQSDRRRAFGNGGLKANVDLKVAERGEEVSDGEEDVSDEEDDGEEEEEEEEDDGAEEEEEDDGPALSALYRYIEGIDDEEDKDFNGDRPGKKRGPLLNGEAGDNEYEETEEEEEDEADSNKGEKRKLEEDTAGEKVQKS